MEIDYWLERWKQGEIGFHQNETNPYLRQYWQELSLAQGSQVFVPLCGKSRDMLWLHEQGHSLLGVELSAIAVHAFFEENRLSPQRVTSGKFDRYAVNGISILCGNFFDLGKDDLAKVSAVYDRASLVALPPQLRKRYVDHLVNILPAATQILFITFDYPQSEMLGPPFAVSPGEVAALYQQHAEIRLLAQIDVLAQNQRFRERGLSQLQESVFLLTTH
ncbi:thiopurine S-methyltransferase [Nitrosomonas sp. Nm132]|uniref:thiopurine S-methyltransferase n=1 Tax=Nitrosomonas sp. Nm132 TaxID=1881053 RepID=UPI000885808F|nr:thiopurine S-methyltransferase [Nitrosomonas sp. Nm132]SDH76086.1 thiopurine S-methyltransferase [Nitrosomonas sp. Nm132]